MTSYVPIVKNNANGAIFYVSLAPRTANGQWQSNPTLASGDVKISLDGGSLSNLNTLPAVTPASSKLVKVTLSQAETNADNIAIVFSDAAGAEWCDLTINLQTTAKQFDDLASQTTADNIYSRIGAPVGASISADIAGVQADTDNIQTRLPAALVSGRMDASVGAMANDVITNSAIATDAIGSAELAASAASEIGTAVWAATTRELTSGANIALAKGTGITGFNDLSAAQVNAEADAAIADAALATAANITSLQSHGDVAWATADVSDLPTNAELATALAGADDATLAAIAALNNLSAADVNAQADQALADAGVTTVRMGHLDADVSSRLAASSYTAPDDTAVLAAIAGLNDLSAAEVNAEVDTAIADAALATAASLASTDGKVDAVKDKTDQLGFSGSLVNANIAAVNGTQVQGHGTTGNEWGPA